jgi:transcriptional regulator with XRE-family HTH domain
MNPIEKLRNDLVKRFPGINAELDAPADLAGLWQLDVRPGGDSTWLVVEWKPQLGFGVSTAEADDYGTKPDELYPNAKAAYDRVVQIILSGGHTDPPAAVRLAELRQVRKLSQAEVAGRAGIKQAAIARIEGRDDILLSTLYRIVSAMGGRLSIRAEFPDGTGRELTGLVSQPSDGPVQEMEVRRQPALAPTKSTSVHVRAVGLGPKGSVRRPKPGGAELNVGPADMGKLGERPSKDRGTSPSEGARKKATGKAQKAVVKRETSGR